MLAKNHHVQWRTLCNGYCWSLEFLKASKRNIWLFFLQKTMVFRPKTYKSKINSKYDIDRKEFGKKPSHVCRNPSVVGALKLRNNKPRKNWLCWVLWYVDSWQPLFDWYEHNLGTLRVFSNKSDKPISWNAFKSGLETLKKAQNFHRTPVKVLAQKSQL